MVGTCTGNFCPRSSVWKNAPLVRERKSVQCRSGAPWVCESTADYPTFNRGFTAMQVRVLSDPRRPRKRHSTADVS